VVTVRHPMPYGDLTRQIYQRFTDYQDLAEHRCTITGDRRRSYSDAELIIIATPIDLRKLIKSDKPALRLRYELQEIGSPILTDMLRRCFKFKHTKD